MKKIAALNFCVVIILITACGSTNKALHADELAMAVPLTREVPKETSTKIPLAPDKILGKGKTDSKSLANFLLQTNPLVEEKFAEYFAELYVEEAELEGVNHDIAFSQMCLETGFLSFGGLVTPEMNNFCGLGSTGPGNRGIKFPSPRIGIRAQIQHLKAYATSAPLNQKIVDPRRRYVIIGSAPTIDDLSGAWAEDTEYAKKIKVILNRLYATSFGS
jgi:hypothetical protein